jgi:hypothetical protein
MMVRMFGTHSTGRPLMVPQGLSGLLAVVRAGGWVDVPEPPDPLPPPLAQPARQPEMNKLATTFAFRFMAHTLRMPTMPGKNSQNGYRSLTYRLDPLAHGR